MVSSYFSLGIESVRESEAEVAAVIAAFGFLSLAASILHAHLTPTIGYEISIYRSTPVSVWVMLAVSAFVGVYLLFYTPHPMRNFGVLMIFLVVISVVYMPVIRGYVLLGQFDVLNHAGSVRELINSQTFLGTILYPATHILAASLSLLGGMSEYHALSVLPGIFVTLYLLSGLLLVRSLDDSWLSTATATIVLSLLLSIITVRLPKIQAVPAVHALFYLMFILWIVSEFDENYSLLYLVAGPALVFYHPQFALVALLAGIASLVGVSLLNVRGQFKRGLWPRLFNISLIIGLVFFEWVSRLPGFRGALSKVLVETSTGGSSGPNPSSSLQQVGGSVPEILLKVFALKFIFATLAAITALWIIVRYWRGDSQDIATSFYLMVITGIVSLPLFGLFTFIGRLEQSFRYFGFDLAIAAVIAAIGIGKIVKRYHKVRTVRVIVSILLICSLVVSFPVLFKSPYVYQPSGQVTEEQLDGYEFVFEHRNTAQITAIDTSPYRVRNAIYGKSVAERGIGRQPNTDVVFQYGSTFRPASTTVLPHFSNRNIHKNLSNDYLITTERARQSNLDMYRGALFNISDFKYLYSRSSRTYTNGDLKAYYFE